MEALSFRSLPKALCSSGLRTCAHQAEYLNKIYITCRLLSQLHSETQGSSRTRYCARGGWAWLLALGICRATDTLHGQSQDLGSGLHQLPDFMCSGPRLAVMAAKTCGAACGSKVLPLQVWYLHHGARYA
jgi:hypothetical protein